MKDTKARFLGFAAIVLACGAYTVGHASADPATEPDSAALELRVAALETQVNDLNAWQQEVHSWQVEKDSTVEQVIDAIAPIDCLAFSTYHGYRETVGPKGRKYHLFPIMLWNVTAPGCKPSPSEFRKRILRARR